MNLLWEFGSDCYYRGKMPFQNVIISSFRVCIELIGSKIPHKTKPNKKTLASCMSHMLEAKEEILAKVQLCQFLISDDFWYQLSPHFGELQTSVEEAWGWTLSITSVNVSSRMLWDGALPVGHIMQSCLFKIAKMQISFIARKTRQSS